MLCGWAPGWLDICIYLYSSGAKLAVPLLRRRARPWKRHNQPTAAVAAALFAPPQEMSFDDFVNQLQETQVDYVEAKKVSWPSWLMCFARWHVTGRGAPTIGQCSAAKHSYNPYSAVQLPPKPAPHLTQPPPQAGDVDGMKRALFQVHETQAFWALPGGEQRGPAGLWHDCWHGAAASALGQWTAEQQRRCGRSGLARSFARLSPLSAASVQRVDYERLNKEPSTVQLNIVPGAEPLVKVSSWGCEAPARQAPARLLRLTRLRPSFRARHWAWPVMHGAACAHPTFLDCASCTVRAPLPCSP